jgi:hypothetical protein
MDENATNACRCLKFDSLCPTGAVQRFSSRLELVSTPHPNLPWQPMVAIAGDHGICAARSSKRYLLGTVVLILLQKVLPLLETIPSG